MIPKKIHFVWIGNIPSYVFFNIETFAKHNPNHKIIIHRELDCLPNLRRAMDLGSNLPQKTDVMRISILQQEAGWYFDCDCRCFGPLDDLEIETDYLVCPNCGDDTVDNWMLGASSKTDFTSINNYYENLQTVVRYNGLGAMALYEATLHQIDYTIVTSGWNCRTVGTRNSRTIIGHDIKYAN